MFFFGKGGGRPVVEAVTPDWLMEQAERPKIVDVREPAEFDGPLGHIEGAILVPLATLPRVAESWPRDEPLVLVCRSGSRSARAALFLQRKGFSRPLNLAGGMIAWNAELRRRRR